MNNLLSKTSLTTSPKLAMDNIADAFAKIEVQDRRVNKVYLPKSIIQHLHVHCLNFDEHLQENKNNSCGYLWGANVFTSDNLKVTSDDNNFAPVSASIECSLDMLINYRIKQNLTIIIKTRAVTFANIAPNEFQAIQTLREIITESEYRHYLKYGFILVKALSGRVYQVFRNRNHTRVYEKGQCVQEMCVRIKDAKIPPTDNVIAFKTIIETDEKQFAAISNVYKF